MKFILIFTVPVLLFTMQSLKADEIKYGSYETKCHWMSCTKLIIQKNTIRRIYKSDKLLDNSDTLEQYTFKNNIIETEPSKEKYYYFSSPASEKSNCNNYVTPEKAYNFCNGKKECVLKYSLCFVAKALPKPM